MLSDFSPHYHRARAERLIALGRVILAGASLVAIYVDPSEPSRFAGLAYTCLAGYLGYALLLLAVAWRIALPPAHLPLLTHIFDLVTFSVLIYFTEGPTSPFYLYFTFSLTCATLRWGLSGTLWTGIFAVLAYVGLGIYTAEIPGDPAFELTRFVIRSVYLIVATILLAYLGDYEQHLRGEISKLATWPVLLPAEMHAMVQELSETAARNLGTPRIAIVWREQGNPQPWLATWIKNSFHLSQESPGSLDSPVVGSLGDKSFLCHDMQSRSPRVLHLSATGLKFWCGAPLRGGWQERFQVENSMLSSKLRGKYVQGRVFFLDGKGLTSDDLTLTEVVAAMMATRMDGFYLVRQLRQAAANDERMHLSQDLHDSCLQSLAAMGLQLSRVLQSLEDNPRLAKRRLELVQRMLVDEQRNLRLMVRQLQGKKLVAVKKVYSAKTLLQALARKLENQWSIKVVLNLRKLDNQVSAKMSQEICYLITEAVVNAARHGRASEVSVEVAAEGQEVLLNIRDNGCGFPFYGAYDHATLTALRIGPEMLKSRVSDLEGSLAVKSTQSGSQLRIKLPAKVGAVRSQSLSGR